MPRREVRDSRVRNQGGRIATTYSASTSRGPNVAVVLGDGGRIEIDSVWYVATGLRVHDNVDRLAEEYLPPVEGRGMHFQAAEAERLVGEGRTASDILPPQETGGPAMAKDMRADRVIVIDRLADWLERGPAQTLGSPS